jgi:glucose-fructose oxidoreductase
MARRRASRRSSSRSSGSPRSSRSTRPRAARGRSRGSGQPLSLVRLEGSRPRRGERASRAGGRSPSGKDGKDGKVRFAVVGLGFFAQAAVLPAFKRAKGVELAALVSDDPVKLRELGDQYKVGTRIGYDQYEELLGSGEVDAVYVCTPNHLHEEFVVPAARHGVHVLCEKPLGVTAAECRRMVDACRRHRVRLMTAYRLHFNKANLAAAEAVHDGTIGTPRFMVSSFAMQVKPTGIRTNPTEEGGGPLYDIGIYCINAARYLFREEPQWVMAAAETGQKGRRFRDIDEQVTAVLGFPGGKTAAFTCSYGAADVACYEVYGTNGYVCLDNAYEFSTGMRLEIGQGDKERTKRFLRRDQVAPELEHFAGCVRTGRDPEPSGKEGLIDVGIIEAVLRSAATGRRVDLRVPRRRRRPTLRQERTVRGGRKPDFVHAEIPFR